MKNKYKFLWVGRELMGVAVALKVKEAGHEVIFYSNPKADNGEKTEIGEQYEDMDIHITQDIKEVEKMLDSKDWIVVVEDTLCTKVVAERIKKGYPTINGYIETEKWETDRERGQKVCEEVRDWNEEHKAFPLNINVLERQEFTSYEEAISFLEEEEGNGPYVIKESGESSNRALNYKGELKSNMDAIIRLQHLAGSGGGEEKFTIQKRLDGIETSVSAFFNGKNFLNFTACDFEHQAFLDKERSINTGEMMNEAMALQRDKNILFEIIMAPLAPALRKMKFHGFVNMNGAITAKGYHPYEWTMRAAGTPWVFQVYEQLLDEYDYGEFLADIALERDSQIEFKNGYTIGVRVDVPPSVFPGISGKLVEDELNREKGFEKFKAIVSTQSPENIVKYLEKFSTFKEHVGELPLIIEGFTHEMAKHVHFTEIKDYSTFKTDEGEDYCVFTAVGPTVLYLTANGSTPKIAGMMIDTWMDKMSGVRFVTRSDYGEKVQENLEKLEALGIDIFPHVD